jgi:ABC-type lipoprotein export system ATPase subunit
MKELNRTERTTFVFSTHDSRVLACASHSIQLADGKLLPAVPALGHESRPPEDIAAT